MNIVAQMLVRNEADIIQECVREIFRWVDTLVVLDGASTDGTCSMLRDLASEYAQQNKTLFLHSRPDPEDRFADHYRNELLQLTYRFMRPGRDWIISVDADEIFHVDEDAANGIDPAEAIRLAEENGGTVVRSFIPQFWLTFDDLRHGALVEDETISVQTRRRWYSWGHAGTFIWKSHPDHFYPQDTPKRTPERPGLNWNQWQRPGPVATVCKHYCIRGMQQGLDRARERLARGGRKYFGKYALPNWVIDERIVRLHYFDPTDEYWVIENNHDRLYEYMSGEYHEQAQALPFSD